MRQRIRFGTRQISALALAAIGVFAALFDRELPGYAAFSHGFAHAFPAHFSPQALADAFFWQLLPVIAIALSGCLLFPRAFCSAVIALRALIDGYVFCGMIRGCREITPGTVILLIFIAASELLTLLCMNTSSRLAERFSRCARNGVRKKDALRYTRDQLFYIGLIFLLYLLRGGAVLLQG